MGRARRVVLETRTFEKAGDATNFFREILHKYSLGETVSESDALELIALLERHDEKTQKIGCGISHFQVGTPAEYSGRCFWIVRSDGSREDFSFTHCLDPKPYD